MSAKRVDGSITDLVIKDCLEIVPPTDYMLVEVTTSGRIDQYVEKVTGQPYIKGSAFYQLCKEVLVQASKQIYIFDRQTQNVYQGVYARALLGIPETNCKLAPDYNGRFDVFIQSTSLNRKLISGTKLLILR